MDLYELLGIKSPDEIAKDVAVRFKQCRKQKHLTQKQLAQKSNIKYGTIRHFERTGRIGFLTLIELAYVLGLVKDLALLFKPENHKDPRLWLDDCHYFSILK